VQSCIKHMQTMAATHFTLILFELFFSDNKLRLAVWAEGNIAHG